MGKVISVTAYPVLLFLKENVDFMEIRALIRLSMKNPLDFFIREAEKNKRG
jgi:hypothetical protein